MSGGVSKLAQVVVGAVVGFAQGGPWGAVIGAGLAFYAAEQQEKLNTKSPLRDNEPSAQTVRSSKAPARFILGRVSTGGVLVWAQEQAGTQTEGEWLHLVYVLCEGAVDGLENIYLGEEDIATYGEHASYELVVDPTTVNAFLKANCPDWKDEQIGRGLSFVRLSLKYSAEKFPSGIPDARFIVRGRNDIYDPRTGMSIYTENTALHILWFLRNRCGVPDDEIVFETFASGANVCDESVGNPDGTTSPRYRSSCVIGADEQRTNVLQKFEAACGGKVIRVGGRWMFQAGAYYGPYDFEVTEDMVIGTITGSTEPTNDAAINTVRGTFIDPSQSWTETDYPEVSVAEWIIEDGGEAAETLSFSYVPYPYQAQRLANIELRRRRAGGTINVPMNFLGYNCRPGRAVRVNLPSLNILGEFIVTNWSMGSNEGCTVSLQQYDAAQFDDAVGQPYNPIGFINLPTGGLGSPTNLAWVPDETAEVIQGVLSWVQPTGIVTAYAVTVRQGANAVQAQQVPATTLQLPIAGLPSGNYTMSVAALGPLTRSGEASITVNIDGPPIPEACTVQSTIDTITLIPGNTLHGLNGGTYEYFFSTNPQDTQGDYVGQGLSLTHTGLAFATNYAYFIRSKNAYGVSAFLKVVASTSNDMTNMLGALKDKIDSGILAPELRKEIELISGPPSIPGSVNSRLQEVNEQLQDQIDAIADLADSMPYDPEKTYSVDQGVLGPDGKIYQASQAVPTNTPPPNVAYWTDVGQAVRAAGAMAARVTAVETKVTEQDGKLTAQAQRIDSVQTSLDGKANASTVDSIANRLTQTEQGLTSQGSAITGLTNSLNTTNGNVTAAQQAAQAAATAAGAKGEVIYGATAPAAEKRLAQNLWIDTNNNANTPKRWNGSAWVAVSDKVATDAAAAAASAIEQLASKADVSALQALQTTVTQQGTTITSQGTSITQIKASIGQQPDNLLRRGSFEDGLIEPWTTSGSVPTVAVGVTAHPSAGKAIAFYANSFCGVNPDVVTAPGEQFDVSADIYRDYMTAGQTGNFQMQFFDKAGASVGYVTAFTFSAGGSFQKFTGRITAPAGAVSARFLTRLMPVDGSGRSLWCNIIARRVTAADTANADAVSSLSSMVTQQGNTITSQGQALTALTNRVTDAEGVNSVQATAISQIDTTVKQQGSALTAQATRIDGLYVQVNPEMEGDSSGLAGETGAFVGVWTEQSARIEDGVAMGKRVDTVQSQVDGVAGSVQAVSASVQMVSETVAAVDGRVSAISSWKTETNSNGKKVATGIVQGSDGTIGEILLSADRVAIINGINGPEANLFVFQNGQLYLNSALINQAYIQNLIVGMTLKSQAVNAQGLPLIEINLVTGAFTVRGQDANGSTLLNNGGLYVYDANGIQRTAVGRLG